eukprot:CAMPEP_0179004464 /NCGR_PEP_ID=MMETSP0795-20121207/13321_1 /TAXON_ID=88552 /ORGANISM="Amoebophrya sp., Strain Ameob2" /LENGTH=32 /DNA_ID= /DNA_START= /DNA_END= /DNA_ORIENTATION=
MRHDVPPWKKEEVEVRKKGGKAMSVLLSNRCN